MAHFYGVLDGARGEATRCGSRLSGMTTTCASWSGAITCRAYQKRTKDDVLEDWVEVCMVPWRGKGTARTIYDGPMGEYRGHFCQGTQRPGWRIGQEVTP